MSNQFDDLKAELESWRKSTSEGEARKLTEQAKEALEFEQWVEGAGATALLLVSNFMESEPEFSVKSVENHKLTFTCLGKSLSYTLVPGGTPGSFNCVHKGYGHDTNIIIGKHALSYYRKQVTVEELARAIIKNAINIFKHLQIR